MKKTKIRFQRKNPADVVITRSRSIDGGGNEYYNERVEVRGEERYRIYGRNGKQYIKHAGEEEKEITNWDDFESEYETGELWEELQSEISLCFSEKEQEELKKIAERHGAKLNLEMTYQELQDDEDWYWKEEASSFGIEYEYWGGYAWVEFEVEEEKKEQLIKAVLSFLGDVYNYEVET